MIPLGIEPATSRLVTECLYQMRLRVIPKLKNRWQILVKLRNVKVQENLRLNSRHFMSTGGPQKRTDGEMDRLTDRLNRWSAGWSQTNLEIAFVFELLRRIADQKYCFINIYCISCLRITWERESSL
jgi:hypothetical protein